MTDKHTAVVAISKNFLVKLVHLGLYIDGIAILGYMKSSAILEILRYLSMRVESGERSRCCIIMLEVIRCPDQYLNRTEQCH